MKRVKILVLHLGTGGAENAISSLSNILCEKYDVEIISTYKINEKPAFYLNPKIKIKYLMEDLKPNPEEFKKAIKEFNILNIFKEGVKAVKVLYLKKKLMIDEIKKINMNQEADIVITTRDIHNKWLGKYGKNIKLKIGQEHNHHNNNQKYIKKIVKCVEGLDYFMPVSKELSDFYEKEIARTNQKTKVKYIPNCLEIYPEEVSDLEGKNIVTVGRLSKEKGYLDLIDIFKKLKDKKQNMDWKLNIVGDGDQYQLLKEKIQGLGLENDIILYGFKNKKELEEIMLKSSIYVMTSYTESFGLVLLEAQSYAIPVLAFDSAQGAKEIIHDNRDGYLIKNRNQEEMVDKLIKLIDNKNLRQEIGQEGRKNSEKYRIDNVKKLWFEFLKELENEGEG